jgi:hypothetical protein
MPAGFGVLAPELAGSLSLQGDHPVPDTDTPRPTPHHPGDHPNQAVDHPELVTDQAPGDDVLTVGGPRPGRRSPSDERARTLRRQAINNRMSDVTSAYLDGSLSEADFEAEIRPLHDWLSEMETEDLLASQPVVPPEAQAAHRADLLARRLQRRDLTVEDRDFLLARQHDRCAICGVGEIPLEIDVDPRSRVVRGMLCHLCALALDRLGHDPVRAERVARYLAGEGPAEAPAPDAPR